MRGDLVIVAFRNVGHCQVYRAGKPKSRRERREMKLTLHEIELLAQLLARAGVTEIEAIWANALLAKLRVIVREKDEDETEDAAEG